MSVKEECFSVAIPRMFPPEYAEQALKLRAMFVCETGWKNLGLPEGPEDVE